MSAQGTQQIDAQALVSKLTSCILQLAPRLWNGVSKLVKGMRLRDPCLYLHLWNLAEVGLQPSWLVVAGRVCSTQMRHHSVKPWWS
jgi:hypothetical protein